VTAAGAREFLPEGLPEEEPIAPLASIEIW
jgi:hypothetical protein